MYCFTFFCIELFLFLLNFFILIFFQFNSDDGDSSGIKCDLLHNIVADAGKKAGLLNRRPGKGGQYGRFIITKWDVEKNKKD